MMAGISQHRYLRRKVTGNSLIKGAGVGMGLVDLNLA